MKIGELLKKLEENGFEVRVIQTRDPWGSYEGYKVSFFYEDTSPCPCASGIGGTISIDPRDKKYDFAKVVKSILEKFGNERSFPMLINLLKELTELVPLVEIKEGCLYNPLTEKAVYKGVEFTTTQHPCEYIKHRGYTHFGEGWWVYQSSVFLSGKGSRSFLDSEGGYVSLGSVLSEIDSRKNKKEVEEVAPVVDEEKLRKQKKLSQLLMILEDFPEKEIDIRALADELKIANIEALMKDALMKGGE